jgi:hypothetical protein
MNSFPPDIMDIVFSIALSILTVMGGPPGDKRKVTA